MQVRNSKNPDFGRKDLIDNAIGKASRSTPTAVACERMPRFGKLGDSLEGAEDFEQELIAEAGLLPL